MIFVLFAFKIQNISIKEIKKFRCIMSFKVLSAKLAASVDQELMSSGGFSIDQLVSILIVNYYGGNLKLIVNRWN